MDKKLVIAFVGGIVGGWIAKEVYDHYKETGKLPNVDAEKIGKIKEGMATASRTMNAVSNLSKEARLL